MEHLMPIVFRFTVDEFRPSDRLLEWEAEVSGTAPSMRPSGSVTCSGCRADDCGG